MQAVESSLLSIRLAQQTLKWIFANSVGLDQILPHLPGVYTLCIKFRTFLYNSDTPIFMNELIYFTRIIRGQ